MIEAEQSVLVNVGIDDVWHYVKDMQTMGGTDAGISGMHGHRCE